MGSQGPSILMADLQTGQTRGFWERSQSVTQESMQSWWASRVQGHGSTQEDGGSEGSSSVRHMKQRRGASGARGAAIAWSASGAIEGGEFVGSAMAVVGDGIMGRAKGKKLYHGMRVVMVAGMRPRVGG